jgi:mono/diheme cytochrome c family protein
MTHAVPLLLAASLGIAPADGERPIDYNRDIRPILSENCFTCHGPDAEARKADLRLDRKADALAERKGGTHAVVPGDADSSEVVFRVETDDDTARMPPADSGKTLTAEQTALIRRWVDQGAPWSEHWAFLPPRRPQLPQDEGSVPIENPIDAFVLARLKSEGLKPSPEADKVTLIRRLSLDLIGLPPTEAEVDAFLADRAPNAYDRLVERLLASPHYGERWGRIWLDAARYADSDGYEKDKPRSVWFFRDWVINALNRDLPYDRFIIEQIAGDMLPDATQDQRVATGFLRNSMLNEEGGVDPEQFRMEAMFDRMDAIGTGILGLTVRCAQCHTHKYDPLTHTDYYRMFAFLNDCHEASIAAYTPAEQAKREEVLGRVRSIEGEIKQLFPDWSARMRRWEKAVADDRPDWQVVRPELDSSGGQKHDLLEDGSILAAGYAPTKHTTEFAAKTGLTKVTAVRLEILNDPSLPLGGPGRSIEGLFGLTEFKVVAAPADKPGEAKEVKVVRATADANPDEKELAPIFDDKSKRRRVTGPIDYAIDGKDETAWGIDIGPGRSNVPRNAVFVLETPVEFPAGATLTFKLVQNHGGWNSDDNQNNNLGRFRFSVTDAPDPSADAVPPSFREILAVAERDRAPLQQDAVFSHWRTTVADYRDFNERIEAAWREHPKGSSQLVLQARRDHRASHRLERGDFLKPAETVEPGVPSFLNPLPSDAEPTRLTFARWLVDRESPTTARAIVNRVWQAYFGRGIVGTTEDLGSQGEPPTHRELLDWLAVEFMDRGWRLKELHRQIVTSQTYRQSSRVTPDLLARDPENRLLARGPRYRVDSEIVRDIALAASGLLDREVGGPSVFPPAPGFLFEPPASYGPKVWTESNGPSRYRRALYTFRYRSVPYPMLQAFDAPNGDIACVRRTRSNTPLQALTTLNEPMFLESARALAMLTLREGGATDRDRLSFAFRRCVARIPCEAEMTALQGLLRRQSERFRRDGADPWALAAVDPKNPPQLPEGAAPADLAAWTAVSRVLLNLDETITKE